MNTRKNTHPALPRRLLTGMAVTAALLFACGQGYAQEKNPPNPVIVHVTGNYHAEARDYVGSADGFDVLAGVDFLVADIWGGLYVGPRVGWYAETVCTAYLAPELALYQKPSLGGQLYIADQATFLPWFYLPYGVAFDVLFNLDELHAAAGEPFYLYLSVFVGARVLIMETVHLEIRLDAGFFPFFDPAPIFIKGGLQVGWQF